MHINDVFIWEIILFLYGFGIVHGSLYNVVTTLIPRWYHVDTNVVPTWYQRGINVVLTWYQRGNHIIPGPITICIKPYEKAVFFPK